jgi:Ca2+-binding RTX toxin-like protein
MCAVAIFHGGIVNVVGRKGADTIAVSVQGPDVKIDDNGAISLFPVSAVNKIAIIGYSGDDTITVDDAITASCWIDGGAGNDNIKGGSGDDVLGGGQGDDTINGSAGNDKIFGRTGNDNITAGDGNDIVVAGAGNDIVHGGDGNDILFGGAGLDELYGELGADICDGGAGNDKLDGGDANDHVFGDQGADQLFGGDGNDYLDAGAGNDSCLGGNGDDKIKGGAGFDSLDGEAGDNLLDPDVGGDTTSNGLVVDIDSQLTASWKGPHSASYTGTFELVNDGGTLVHKLTLNVHSLDPNAPLGVTVNNQPFGQFTTDGSGNGQQVFSTNPGAGEDPFPGGFTTILPKMKLQLGPARNAKFVNAKVTEPKAPGMPMAV